MKSLVDAIQGLPPYHALLKLLKEPVALPGLGLPRAVRLPFLTALHADLDYAVLLVTDRAWQDLSGNQFVFSFLCN